MTEPDILINFIKNVPKTELHIHIEGALEPELMLKLASKNNLKLKYASPEEIRKAYRFKNLQSFLDIYYQGTRTLITEEDFYMLTLNYIQRAVRDNVIHAEIFFDPQAHISRGVKFDTVLNGIYEALRDGRNRFGFSGELIMCFLRDHPEDEAMRVLDMAISYTDTIKGVGLDSAERNNPPSKFSRVFEKAREHGFLTVAHAGEEGPPEYVKEAVELLKIIRIDHGIRAVENKKLLQSLGRIKIPFTLCPLSNLKLNVVRDLRDYPIRKIMSAGVLATVNSDDPAYFGGYVNENFLALHGALNLKPAEILTLAKNSVLASFMDVERKSMWIEKIEDIYRHTFLSS